MKGGQGAGVGPVGGRLFKFDFCYAKFWVCFGWVGVWRLRTSPPINEPCRRSGLLSMSINKGGVALAH